MTWGVLNAAMLAGLLGVLIPLLVHLWSRRHEEMIDWGAMMFLELGERERRRPRLAGWLVMLTRMALLALVALALARPFWTPSGSAAGADATRGGGGRRDVVLVLDGSASMGRKVGGTTPRALALRWARGFVARLRPGDAVAVVVAGERARALVDPPSVDRGRIEAALDGVAASRGSSDLPSALVEAFRILERAPGPGRDVIVLGDGQRFAWRAGEPMRWGLVRDLHRRAPGPPHLWALAFGAGTPPDAPNGSLGPITTSRALVTPGMPVTVTTSLANAGPGPLTRAVELLVDGRAEPGSGRVVGPVPVGGKASLSFRVVPATLGEHLLSVRLVGDDAMPGDDEASAPIVVTAALPVLLVDGEPGLEPLSGATDFLRAALAPTGLDAAPIRASVVTAEALDAAALEGRRVVVLADVERLRGDQAAALGRFVEAGGGLVLAPGDRAAPEAWNAHAWMPARLGAVRGDSGRREAVAHPAPRTFRGPVLSRFARGDAPPLAEADLFAYRLLDPSPGSSVTARLDTGDPWAVEGRHGRGRVLLLAAPLGAGAGTLPVNPEFVPLVHEWAFHLASGRSEPRAVRPGEPLAFDLDPPPAAEVATLPLRVPGGAVVPAPVVRSPGAARAVYHDTSEPGVYRLSLPGPPGGFAHASVVGDPREFDLTPLGPGEAEGLARGWPLTFEPDPDRLAGRLFSPSHGRNEVWRGLVLAALAGLCLELWLTRRLVRGQVGPARGTDLSSR